MTSCRRIRSPAFFQFHQVAKIPHFSLGCFVSYNADSGSLCCHLCRFHGYHCDLLVLVLLFLLVLLVNLAVSRVSR